MTSNSSPSLADALAAGTVVLDGGMSNQLASAGHDLSDELWSARLLADRPDSVADAHLAYFRAGADVAITASYQATFEGFAQRGIGPGEAARLLALSVELDTALINSDIAGGYLKPLDAYTAQWADWSQYA
ncbi:homocysteine S-methyltransferase family protein, partial [Streptomyces sp. NPDC005921]